MSIYEFHVHFLSFEKQKGRDSNLVIGLCTGSACFFSLNSCLLKKKKKSNSERKKMTRQRNKPMEDKIWIIKK